MRTRSSPLTLYLIRTLPAPLSVRKRSGSSLRGRDENRPLAGGYWLAIPISLNVLPVRALLAADTISTSAPAPVHLLDGYGGGVLSMPGLDW